MSYFLTDQKILENSIIKLSGEEVRHVLLARRMKKGERFNLQGVDEKRYVVEIKEIGRNELKLEVVEKVKTPAEPEVKITLFQSYVNEKALDFVFQKSTELGAYKIVLFNSQNAATKLSAVQFSSKSVRWNKILWEAAKQSDRIHPPALEYLKSLEDVKKAAKDFEKVFLCDIGGEKTLVKEKLSSAAIIVGPEGGLTAAEIDNIKSLPNCQTITLGSIMLRAETASLASLAIIKNTLD